MPESKGSVNEVEIIKMPDRSPVFDRNTEFYLEQIRNIPLEEIADFLGVDFVDNHLIVPFLGKKYKISRNGIWEISGEKPPYTLCVVLFKYLLTSPRTVLFESPWCSYRDFKDACPLIVFFSNDVENAIVNHFSGKMDHLKKACESLGGKEARMDVSYDLAMQLTALPKIPMLLLFNDADDEFPAQCSVLFQKSIEGYLDMESVAILGYIFSNMLIATDQGEIYE